MRGAEPLIAMRMAGAVPLSVEIRDEAPGWISSEWQQHCPRFAQIAIDQREPLDGLDLRCVVGLPVQIASTNRARLGQLLRRVKAEKPARLLGLLFDDRSELVAVYDSEGVATWPTS
jgi:hypothetical protein